MLKKILAPTDFSDGSRNAIDYAVQLADKFEATLCLLHVGQAVGSDSGGTSRTEIYQQMRDEQVRVANARMDRLVTEIHDVAPNLTIEAFAVSGTPHDAIIDAAAEHGADMIVMGTAGLTGFSRFLIGSTAERVVRISEVPVLTVRGPAPNA